MNVEKHFVYQLEGLEVGAVVKCYYQKYDEGQVFKNRELFSVVIEVGSGVELDGLEFVEEVNVQDVMIPRFKVKE